MVGGRESQDGDVKLEESPRSEDQDAESANGREIPLYTGLPFAGAEGEEEVRPVPLGMTMLGRGGGDGAKRRMAP
jgi:hypothetical protein